MNQLSQILLLLLIAINVNGQINRFNSPSALEDGMGKKGIITDLAERWPAFEIADSKYIVTYELGDDYKKDSNPKLRDLFIFRYDESTGTWSKASDIIQTDYEKHSIDFHQDYSTYKEHRYHESSKPILAVFGFGNVFTLENGYVVLFITNIYYSYKYELEGIYTEEKPDDEDAREQSDGTYFVQTKYRNDKHQEYNYNSIIFCVPNKSNSYFTTTRFEPVDRKILRNEASKLNAKNAQIRITDHGIDIDMYFKVRDENYVNPIKDPVKESEIEQWNKLEYENATSEHAKTYHFAINGSSIDYLGDELVKKK